MSEGTPALATHLDLIEWNKTHGQWWSEWFASAFTIKAANPSTFRRVLETMATAETVFVSKEMCAVIEKAANELPDIPLQEENLMWRSAFIYYERPIRMDYPIARGEPTTAIRAVYGHHAAQIQQAESADQPIEDWKYYPGVIHVTFVDGSEVEDTFDVSLGINTFPFDLSGWTYGKRWETVPMGESEFGSKIDVSLSQQRKVFLATHLIAAQYIALVSGARGGRQQRRRAERMDMPNFGDITYVTLRRATSRGSNIEGDEGEAYSHRFMVSGHWRHQWYPSKGEHHVIWIDPFVKGPDDKPLIVKDKVWKLVR